MTEFYSCLKTEKKKCDFQHGERADEIISSFHRLYVIKADIPLVLSIKFGF